MRLTIDLRDELVEQAMAIHGRVSLSGLLEMGLQALVDADGRRRLAEAFGSQRELGRVDRNRPAR
jgi:hypothetical protein